MKKALLFLSIVAFYSNVKSQTFTLDPGNVDTVEAPANILSIFDIYQNNISSNAILLKWTKISVALPAGWDYSLCDLGHCYTGIPASGTMDSVDVGQMGLLGLNINPYNVTGQGIVKLYVYDAAFPSTGDTVTWVVNAGSVSVTEISNVWNGVTIYPNPTSDFITLSGVPQTCFVSVFEMTGKLVESFTVNQNQKTINTSAYNNGTYLMVIRNEKGIVGQQRFIVKK